MIVSGEGQGGERKRTTAEVSKRKGRRQNWGLIELQDKSEGNLFYRLGGVRHKGSANLIQALVWNVGTCRPDVKGEAQMGGPHKGESTDAGHRGGAVRSRGEGSVMELDRRGCVVQLYLQVNQQWEEPCE
jgi:hypothetical protein